MKSMTTQFRVNGRDVEVQAEPRTSLADCLRRDLKLTGTHLGCEHGVCGACTIILNGAAVRSCLMLAVQADGADIITIEGLADGDFLARCRRHFASIMLCNAASARPVS